MIVRTSRIVVLVATFLFTQAGINYAQPPKEVTNSIGMKLRLISKGQFTMGSPVDEEGSPATTGGSHEAERQHEVTLSKDFYLGTTEVTVLQFQNVMAICSATSQADGDHEITDAGVNHPSERLEVLSFPVSNVSWNDAIEFCNRLTLLSEERAAGRVYRLPTESEWEYACRAGTTTAFYFGESVKDLISHEWMFDNSGKQPHPVGQKTPNNWGLFDLLGNVSEWCSDKFAVYPEEPTIDPSGPVDGNLHVIRGGNWLYPSMLCRSASRLCDRADLTSSSVGFRVAMTNK